MLKFLLLLYFTAVVQTAPITPSHAQPIFIFCAQYMSYQSSLSTYTGAGTPSMTSPASIPSSSFLAIQGLINSYSDRGSCLLTSLCLSLSCNLPPTVLTGLPIQIPTLMRPHKLLY